MALTRSFKELVQKRVVAEPAFGEASLRDCIKAAIGSERLGAEAGTHPTSLICRFSPHDNPQARNLFNVLGHQQKRAGLELLVAHEPQ